jgi:hypothetical protein
LFSNFEVFGFEPVKTKLENLFSENRLIWKQEFWVQVFRLQHEVIMSFVLIEKKKVIVI